jgi:hypothetical protein
LDLGVGFRGGRALFDGARGCLGFRLMRGIVMVRCYCGDGWIWRHQGVVDVVCAGSASTLDSLTAFKSVEICRILAESLLVSKSVEICRSFVSG